MGEKRTVNLEDAERMSRSLGRTIAATSPRADVIVGLARGGLFPALLAAQEAGIDYLEMHVERRVSRIKHNLRHLTVLFRLMPSLPKLKIVKRMTRYLDARYNSVDTQSRAFRRMNVRGRNVMIVDDCVDSGLTASYARDILLRNGASSVRVAVLCWGTKYDSQRRYALVPDIFLDRGVHIFPWSFHHEEHRQFLGWMKTRPTTVTTPNGPAKPTAVAPAALGPAASPPDAE